MSPAKSAVLPSFKYFPTAYAEECAVIEDTPGECLVCEQERSQVYTGPVYSEEELDASVCPWCIADGAAHKKFGAMFNPIADFDADGETISQEHNRLGDWQNVSKAIIEEICYRTPAMRTWQEGKWFFHCNDGAVFLGPVGFAELQKYGQPALDAIAAEAEESGVEHQDIDEWMKALTPDGGSTAYLFKCGKCGTFGGFSDCD